MKKKKEIQTQEANKERGVQGHFLFWVLGMGTEKTS